jgi:hypothetical protein
VKIILEPETADDNRTMFRLRIDAKVIGEGRCRSKLTRRDNGRSTDGGAWSCSEVSPFDQRRRASQLVILPTYQMALLIEVIVELCVNGTEFL